MLVKDWIDMGEEMSQAPSGSVRMVHPQSPVALLTALCGLHDPGGPGPGPS